MLGRARGRRSGTFDVGLLVPTSGAMALLGPCAYACARLARDLWNAQGGVDGREVRLTVLNASESAAALDTELGELLDDRGVDALVALSNTAVCRRIAAVVDARVPLVYTPMFEGAGLPDWVHAIGETPDRQLLPAIDWMTTRYRPRRWYLIGNDYSWPRRTHALAIPFLGARGAEVVGERYVPLGERGFGPIVEAIAASRAEAVLVSLLAGDAVHLCREFERAGLGGRVLRLSVCIEENAVLGVGCPGSDGMFVAAGYFAALDSDVNGAFKERYRALFGERAPTLNSASQSVYEGFVHLHRQVHAADVRRRAGGLTSVRNARHGAYDAGRDPIFLGEVQGLGIRPIGQLAGAAG
jgi:urea transport system substrate-binding protein